MVIKYGMKVLSCVTCNYDLKEEVKYSGGREA